MFVWKTCLAPRRADELLRVPWGIFVRTYCPATLLHKGGLPSQEMVALTWLVMPALTTSTNAPPEHLTDKIDALRTVINDAAPIFGESWCMDRYSWFILVKDIRI